MSARIFQLPDEVFLDILHDVDFKDLSSCCLVSHEFCRLARDTTLWRGAYVKVKPDESIPTARLWCSTVASEGKMYMYGGHTTQEGTNVINVVMNDLFEYDFASNKWSALEHQMGGKTEHKCVMYGNALWFTGGYNGTNYTNNIHKYDLQTKVSTLVETNGEPFCNRSALTSVVWKNNMIVFGGWNGFTKKWFNDVYSFNFDTSTWRKIEAKGDIPPQRTSHTAVVKGNSMYVFGGFSGSDYLNDFYEFNLETETWTNLTNSTKGIKPSPRSRFCAAVHGNLMVVMGGWNKVNYFADIHTYDFETNTWHEISNKMIETPAISQYSLAIHKNFLYVFGGYDATKKECVNQLLKYKLDIEEEEWEYEPMDIMTKMEEIHNLEIMEDPLPEMSN